MGLFILFGVLFLAIVAGLYVWLYNVSDRWHPGLRRLLPVGFVALVVSGLMGDAFLYVTSFAVDGPTLEQGRERASDLQAALEQFKSDQGRYPPDLDPLVPDYLDEIPRPAWRYDYVYRQCASGAGYVLSFKEAGIPDGSCAYSSGSGEWKCSADLPGHWWESCNW